MANAWVTEWFRAAVINNNVIQAPEGLPLRTQKVTFTGTAGVTTNAIGADCNLVELYVDANACFEGGDAPTATSSDAPISAGQAKFIVPTPKSGTTRPKFSFITQ